MASNLKVCSFAYEGNLAKLKDIIAENVKASSDEDSNQRMPLHWACSGGHKDIFDYLVHELKVPLNHQDDAGWTPLMIASSAGHEKMVSSLISNQADVNISNYTGQSCLHYAASKDHSTIAEILLKNGADPNVNDKTTGATPLHRASSRGHLKIVNLLIVNGSKVNCEDIQKNTPLHLACEEERAEVVHSLIKHGADVHTRNKDKQSPADIASLPLRKQLLDIDIRL